MDGAAAVHLYGGNQMLVSFHGERSGVDGADVPFCRVAANDGRVGPGTLIWLPEVPVLAIEGNNYGLVLKAAELCRCEWRWGHDLVMGFWRQNKELLQSRSRRAQGSPRLS